jgi:hypothetical protein
MGAISMWTWMADSQCLRGWNSQWLSVPYPRKDLREPGSNPSEYPSSSFHFLTHSSIPSFSKHRFLSCFKYCCIIKKSVFVPVPGKELLNPCNFPRLAVSLWVIVSLDYT